MASFELQGSIPESRRDLIGAHYLGKSGRSRCQSESGIAKIKSKRAKIEVALNQLDSEERHIKSSLATA